MTTEVTLSKRVIFPNPMIRHGFYSLCGDWNNQSGSPRLNTRYWDSTGNHQKF